MKNNWIIILLVLLVVFVFFIVGGFSLQNEETDLLVNNIEDSKKMMENNTGLVIEDIVVGEGQLAEAGKEITVHYTGTLEDGTKFDSSVDRGTPFTFNLGAGQVIEGWEKGFDGMKIGGQRKLVIPANMAYGEAPGHPLSGKTLVFEVELLDVK